MSELLIALSVLFIVGGGFLLIATRLDLPTIPFFILAGLVVGVFVEEGQTIQLARYGIAFLVFTFGVRLQFDAVRTVLTDSEIVAIAQVFVTGSIGVLAGALLSLPLNQAIYLGIAAALSSTIVGTGLLEADIRKNLVRGRLAHSIQFIQDLLAIAFVLVLSAETFAAAPIATELGYGLVLIAAGALINRFLFDRLGRLSGGSDELMIVGVVALLVAFLGVAEFLGVSIVVGAFAAGLVVRRDPTEYMGLRNGIESITTFFVTVFFVTLGALVSVPTTDVFLAAIVLGLLTAVIKPAVTIGLLIYRGYEARSATLTGLSLNQVSELALVIAIEALLLGLLLPSLFDAIILAAAATMITSSFSQRYDERIYQTLARHGLLNGRHDKIDDQSAVPEGLSDHVVIVGYGRQGQRLLETCEEAGRPYVVIENDPALLSSLESSCGSYVFGDAMERYAREKANVENARLVVSTVDSDRLSERLLSIDSGPDVIVRSEDVQSALELLDRGALYVTVSDVLASEHLLTRLETVLDGDISREELRNRQLAELQDRKTPKYYSMADELDAIG